MVVLQVPVVWILAAAAMGFTLAGLFGGAFGLRRRFFLLAYVPLAGGFCIAFFKYQDISLSELFLHRWGWGLLGAAAVGTVAIRNVLSQPSSPRHRGMRLAEDILWPGLAYGLVDGVLLTVVPVVAVTGSLGAEGWTQAWWGSLLVGSVALLASLFVTAAYHLGYPEFRGWKPLLGAGVGNGLFSLAFLITGSPLAAVLPHMAMHVVAMLHGPESTLQLPPHSSRTRSGSPAGRP